MLLEKLLKKWSRLFHSLEFYFVQRLWSVHKGTVGQETGPRTPRGSAWTWTVKYWDSRKDCDIFTGNGFAGLGLRRTTWFTASVFTQVKDDRVESIYAMPRCDKASTRGKHSNIGNFLWKRKRAACDHRGCSVPDALHSLFPGPQDPGPLDNLITSNHACFRISRKLAKYDSNLLHLRGILRYKNTRKVSFHFNVTMTMTALPCECL